MGISLTERMVRRSVKRRRAPVTPVQVGAELRGAREVMGLSLAEVHDRTGILWRDLEALEVGDLRKMPDRQAANPWASIDTGSSYWTPVETTPENPDVSLGVSRGTAPLRAP